MTSHSSQGQTALRVLTHMDTEKSELLVNNRFAYISVSRVQHDAHIYTNDGSKPSQSLSRESSQRTATEVEQQPIPPKSEVVSMRGVHPAEPFDEKKVVSNLDQLFLCARTMICE